LNSCDNREEIDQIPYRFPGIVLDSILENPFLFDLLKSETVDWEINDNMYSSNPSMNANPIIGFIAGYLSQIVTTFNEPSYGRQYSCPNKKVYLPGRMKKEFLNKLSIQRDRSHNSFFVNLYFPGLSVCYTDYEDALGSLETDQEQNIAPRVIFKICDSQHKFLKVNEVTYNDKDEGMLLGSRLHLKIESMQQVDEEFVYFEACYVNVDYKSI